MHGWKEQQPSKPLGGNVGGGPAGLRVQRVQHLEAGELAREGGNRSGYGLLLARDASEKESLGDVVTIELRRPRGGQVFRLPGRQ